MKIELPEKVKTVIAELKAHGYDAYAVGRLYPRQYPWTYPRRLGYYDICQTASGEGDFSTNRGYRDPAWYRDSFDG